MDGKTGDRIAACVKTYVARILQAEDPTKGGLVNSVVEVAKLVHHIPNRLSPSTAARGFASEVVMRNIIDMRGIVGHVTFHVDVNVVSRN